MTPNVIGRVLEFAAMTSRLPQIVIKEIVRRVDSGITEPILCKSENEIAYCIKGRQALNSGKVAEVISAVVGRKIGLPIPNFAVSNFSSGLIEFSREIPEISLIGLEPGFASTWIEPVDYFSLGFSGKFPDSLLASIFIFDRWIMNGDRTLTEHGGNVNLLVNLSEQKLVLIDHNLAFSKSFFDDDPRLHVGYSAWMGLDGKAQFVLSLRSKMEEAISAISHIDRDLPSEWLEADPSLAENALRALNRARYDEFWDELP